MIKLKKRITLALVCLLTLVSNAQSRFATLSGEIKNYDNQPLLLDNKLYFMDMDTIKVIDGKFSTSISVENPCVKIIRVGGVNYEIFLMPGKSLNVNFDLSKGEGVIKFGGDLATENVILDSLHQQILKRTDVFSLPAQKASLLIDSISTEYKKYIDRSVSTKKVDPSFAGYIKTALDYQCAEEKLVCGLKQQILDTAYYNFTKGMIIENDKFLDSPMYREFLRYYLYYATTMAFNKLDSIKQQSDEVFCDESFKVIDRLKNIKIKDYCLFAQVYSDLEYGGVKGFEKEYDYFKKHNTDTVYAQQIRKLYAKKMALAAGKIAPPFTCKDIKGKDVSLSDFKGKFVYLDFWTTGCVPCRKEFPYLKKLQLEYKDQNIVFVSISLDSDCEDWKKFVIENKMEGICLFLPKGFNSDVAKAYQINGVPSFKLVDKEGRIIDAGAPRPSSDEIRKVIDNLLDGK